MHFFPNGSEAFFFILEGVRVEVCSLEVAFSFAIVRNRLPPFATRTVHGRTVVLLAIAARAVIGGVEVVARPTTTGEHGHLQVSR